MFEQHVTWLNPFVQGHFRNKEENKDEVISLSKSFCIFAALNK